jgi:hypothetical protein
MSLLRRYSPVAFAFLLACGGPTAAPQSPDTKPEASASAAPATTGAAPVASASPAPAAPVATPEPAQAAADPPLPQAGPPVVTLIDPGAEPRKPLRYAFQKKAESVEMDMKMSMAMNVGGRASPMMTMPTIRMTLELKPESIDKDGTVTATVLAKKAEVLKDAPVPPEVLTKLSEQIQGMVGLKGRAVITSRGFTKEASMEAPPNAAPQLKQILDSMKDSLRDMSMPLPEEPVGKNAKWEVKTVIVSQLTTAQKATYTAKELGAKSATLDATVVQNAPPQRVQTPPNMPAGALVHLDSHSASGSGTVKLSLDKMTPTSSMKLAAKSVMSITLGADHQDIGTDLAMEMSIKPSK